MPVGPPGAAGMPCVPLQQVADEELSSHLLFLTASEIAPIISILSACFKGTSSANTAVEANTVQRRGLLRQGERKELDLSLHSCPDGCLPGCAVQREDTSRHNLEQTK